MLRALRIGEPREAVVAALIAEAVAIECATEPLATVDINLHVERQPGLQANMHETENWVQVVVVEKLTLAGSQNELEVLLFTVPADVETAHRLDRLQHADQASFDSVSVRDRAGQLVFSFPGRLQKKNGTPELSRSG